MKFAVEWRRSVCFSILAVEMENSPLSNQVDIRLRQLDRQIHNSLKVIRQHLQELEEVEQRTRGGDAPAAGRNFADLLDDALGEKDDSAP